jgi:hypothetical protein
MVKCVILLNLRLTYQLSVAIDCNKKVQYCGCLQVHIQRALSERLNLADQHLSRLRSQSHISGAGLFLITYSTVCSNLCLNLNGPL